MPGFNIPNTPDAAFTDQTEPDAVDFQIVSDQRFGTISGGDVTGFGTPSMGVAVSTWTGVVDGTLLTITGGNVTVSAASASARFDLIVALANGTFGVLQGTASSTNPTFPLWPRTSSPLAAIYIASGTAGILNSMIVPKHTMLPRSYIAQVLIATNLAFQAGAAGTTNFSIDGAGLHKWIATPTDLTLYKLSETQLTTNGSFQVVSTAPANPALNVRGAASQTNSLADFRSSANVVLASVGVDGRLISPNFNRGATAPEGVTTGNVGDLYFQTGGSVNTYETRLWIKMTGTGNTGWKSMVIYDPATAGGIPPGCEVSWPSQGTAPAGWLECNGQAVSRATYSSLFALLGTLHGVGDGSTTFNLPDRTRRVLVGRDTVTTGFTTVGNSGGTFSMSLTGGQLPTHTHTVSQSPYTHSHTGSYTTAGGTHGHGVTDPGHSHALTVNYYPTHNDQHPYATNAALWHFDYGNSSTATTGITVGTAADHNHNMNMAPDTHGHSVSILTAGTSDLVDITPRYVVTRWIIKT